jgi:hypothetical protein
MSTRFYTKRDSKNLKNWHVCDRTMPFQGPTTNSSQEGQAILTVYESNTDLVDKIVTTLNFLDEKKKKND